MSRSIPPLGWFRSFESAARHLSFTAAASELGLTQSAISQQVRSLELRLGVRLFFRRARGLSLTDDGRRLLPEVTSAIATLTGATRSFELDRSETVLNVATSVSFSQWFLAPGLARLHAREPGLRVRIISTVWPDEFTNLAADIEIRFGSEESVGKGADRLGPDELIAVGKPELVDTFNAPHIPSLISVVGISTDWNDWLAGSDYDDIPSPHFYADSHGLAVDMAKNGAGIALTSSLLAGPCIKEGSLVQLGTHSVHAREGYFLAIRDSSSSSSIVFRDWLLSEIDGYCTNRS